MSVTHNPDNTLNMPVNHNKSNTFNVSEARP